MAEHRLLTYGTLMLMPRMTSLLGRIPLSISAKAHNYQAFAIKGADYPGAIAKPNQMLEGKLYLGLSLKDMYRLDVYEGGMYHRQQISVEIAQDHSKHAWLYIIKPCFLYRLSNNKWPSKRWQLSSKQLKMPRSTHKIS